MRDFSFDLPSSFTKLFLNWIVSFGLCVLVVSAQSQEKKESKKTADDDLIKVTSNLVNLDVIVKDKKGRAITDLKPEDFAVLENGVVQKIEFFDSTLAAPEDAAKAIIVANAPVPRQPTGFPRSI